MKSIPKKQKPVKKTWQTTIYTSNQETKAHQASINSATVSWLLRFMSSSSIGKIIWPHSVNERLHPMEMNVFLLGQRHAKKNLANSQKEVKHVNKEQCTVHLAFLRQYVNEVLIM